MTTIMLLQLAVVATVGVCAMAAPKWRYSDFEKGDFMDGLIEIARSNMRTFLESMPTADRRLDEAHETICSVKGLMDVLMDPRYENLLGHISQKSSTAIFLAAEKLAIEDAKKMESRRIAIVAAMAVISIEAYCKYHGHDNDQVKLGILMVKMMTAAVANKYKNA